MKLFGDVLSLNATLYVAPTSNVGSFRSWFFGTLGITVSDECAEFNNLPDSVLVDEVLCEVFLDENSCTDEGFSFERAEL